MPPEVHYLGDFVMSVTASKFHALADSTPPSADGLHLEYRCIGNICARSLTAKEAYRRLRRFYFYNYVNPLLQMPYIEAMRAMQLEDNTIQDSGVIL